MDPRAVVHAGALGFAITGAAVVSAAALADTTGTRIDMKIADRTVQVGRDVRISGAPGRDLAGRSVRLEFAAPGAAWEPMGTATVGQDGRYRFRRELPRSGRVRVVLEPQPGAATASSEPPRSREASVAVAPRVGVRKRRLNVRAGRRARVAGRMVPAARGVRVALQVRDGRRWRTIDRDRTNGKGRFALRDRQRTPRSARVRVVATPYAGLARGRRKVGRLNVYRVAHASWYGPGFYGRRTGCGSTLYPGRLGVAHKTLPCGTKVTFRHRGRVVRVPVIDRGPYVAGREYDLTEATAQRLRFRGHGPVQSTR